MAVLSGVPDSPHSSAPPGDDPLTELLIGALAPSAGEIERLSGVPRCDILQFNGRSPEHLPELRELHAWLYAPKRKIAYAVHTPPWGPPAGAQSRANWDALLHEHFHAHFRSGSAGSPGSAGSGGTQIAAVAMPLQVPFDEPRLKIQPVLALWAAASSGEHYLSETMTMSVRRGAPHVIGVLVFSGAMYQQALTTSGRQRIREDHPFSPLFTNPACSPKYGQ